MQQFPDIYVTLEIDGKIFKAESPRLIFQGRSTEVVEYLPASELNTESIEILVQNSAIRNSKRIYICDHPDKKLRALIPYTVGFIFGEGSTLGHFSGILSHYQVPACIDYSLWKSAREYLMASTTEKRGSFHCGKPVRPAENFQKEYPLRLQTYRSKLNTQSLVVPVYDMDAMNRVSGGTAGNLKIGEKALAINAIQAGGFPTAKAFVLTNVDQRNFQGKGIRGNFIISIVKQMFPTFGQPQGSVLISRGSYHLEDTSHLARSGLIPSPSVTSYEGLISTISSQLDCWKALCDSNDQSCLSFVLQERISTPAWGILGTGRRWDFDEEIIMAELNTNKEVGNEKTLIELSDLQTGLDKKTASVTAKTLSVADQVFDQEKIQTMFSQLTNDAVRLREYYSIPLEIEFVITRNVKHVFVQFRPLFR